MKLHPDGVIIDVKNIPGGSGPDFSEVVLRNGHAVVIGDDGLNVYANIALLRDGDNPDQSLVFSSATTDPSDAALLATYRKIWDRIPPEVRAVQLRAMKAWSPGDYYNVAGDDERRHPKKKGEA